MSLIKSIFKRFRWDDFLSSRGRRSLGFCLVHKHVISNLSCFYDLISPLRSFAFNCHLKIFRRSRWNFKSVRAWALLDEIFVIFKSPFTFFLFSLMPFLNFSDNFHQKLFILSRCFWFDFMFLFMFLFDGANEHHCSKSCS